MRELAPAIVGISIGTVIAVAWSIGEISTKIKEATEQLKRIAFVLEIIEKRTR
jgi:hypothetical protein